MIRDSLVSRVLLAASGPHQNAVVSLYANSSSPRVQNATGSPKSIFFGSARVVAILRCFSSPRCFSTAMRINPMTLTKKDQSSKLPATGEGANDDPHAASPP